jgi:predicted MPP superfamily phosphohydrolase
MALRPDVILLPGDLFQRGRATTDGEIAAMRALLGRLSAPGGVYVVQGNCDSRKTIGQFTEGTDVRLLFNEIVCVAVRDRWVTIGGVELRATSEAIDTVRRLESLPEGADVRLLVSHYPDYVYGLSADSRVDLIVSGHTHGGQIQVPFLGPLLTLSDVPRQVAGGGLHELDGRRLYVSRGVGCERGQAPRVRFCCPPEISLITLE